MIPWNKAKLFSLFILLLLLLLEKGFYVGVKSSQILKACRLTVLEGGMTSAKVTAGDINGKLQIISGRIIMTFILSNEEHELEFCQNQMLDRLKAYIILLQINVTLSSISVEQNLSHKIFVTKRSLNFYSQKRHSGEKLFF